MKDMLASRRIRGIIFSTTAFTTTVTGICALVGVIEAVAVARLLGASAFGVIAIIGALTTTVACLFEIRVSDISAKLYFETSDQDKRHRASILWVSVVASGVIGVLIAGVSALFASVSVDAFTESKVANSWIICHAISISLLVMGNSFSFLQRLSGHFYLIGYFKIFAQVLRATLFLSILWIMPTIDGYYTALVTVQLAYVVGMACLSFYIWQSLDQLPMFNTDIRRSISEYWRERGMLFCGTLLGFTKLMHKTADVLLIGWCFDDHTTGVYRFAQASTAKLYLLYDAWNQTHFPRALEWIHQGATDHLHRAIKKIILAAAALAISLLLFEWLLLDYVLDVLLDSQFDGAATVIMVLTIPFFLTTGIVLWLYPIVIARGLLSAFTAIGYIAVVLQYVVTGIFALIKPDSGAVAAAVGYASYEVAVCALTLPLIMRVAPDLLPRFDFYHRSPGKQVSQETDGERTKQAA